MKFLSINTHEVCERSYTRKGSIEHHPAFFCLHLFHRNLVSRDSTEFQSGARVSSFPFKELWYAFLSQGMFQGMSRGSI
jgi:hypothetical protein